MILIQRIPLVFWVLKEWIEMMAPFVAITLIIGAALFKYTNIYTKLSRFLYS